MFKKLLSNLPFNPSLIGQVSFYAKRMHRESAIRRMGFGMLVLAVFVHSTSAMFPPESTMASSGNDIVRGGFSTREQAVTHCQNQQHDFRIILSHYGIGCDTLASAETVTLRSTDYERKLDSMGRWPQGSTIKSTGKPTDEYGVNINGVTYYMRNLWAWDSGASSSYKFLRMKNAQGIIIMVMYNCGNIVTIDRYTPPTIIPDKPELEIRKENAPTTAVKVGDNITYALVYRNKGKGNATHVRIKDVVPQNTELVSVQPGGNSHTVSPDKRSLEFWHNVPNEVIGYSEAFHVVRYVVKVTKLPADGGRICNTARIESDEHDTDSNEVCNDTIKTITTLYPELELSKKARNITQNIADANNTKAQAGDTIQYTLSVKNKGKGKQVGFVVEESLGDVLEYADIVDLGGGIMDANKIVRWPKVDIGPGDTISRQITVKIKSPIPNTPVSTSHPGSFDLTLNNVYGNTVNITLPETIVKITEQVVTTLPNTGPGESMAAVITLVVIVGYFFMRSRLLAKEYDIIRTDFGAYGGTS